MLLLEAENIEKWIGGRKLFSDINFKIYQGDRIALIGRNGTGKTTLLKILLNGEADYSGRIVNKSEIAYLAQDYNYQLDQTVEEFMIEKTYNYGEFIKLMKKFGFEIDFLDRKVAACSGGEQTKLQLIRLLAAGEVDLLILDEPTNHLDLETRDWLISFLDQFQGAVITVSHERYFLDNVVDEIWELDGKKIKTYPGNYSNYKDLKEAELQQRYKEYEKYQAEKKRLERRKRKQQQFVQKTDSKGKRTDSFWRVTKGSDSRKGRFAKRVKNLESQLEKLDKKEKPYEDRKINPDFDRQVIHDSIIVEAKDLGKSYPDLNLFSELNFRIYQDSKIALIGKNGTGKSILLKIILGEINESSGQIIKSSGLNIGYFSQKLENLDPGKTLFEELKDKNPDKEVEVIRTFLGSMLFEGEDVFKQIKDLSTGEKVRIAFALLLLGKYNLLLLDEPLNHLDINSREIIEEALNNYNGAFLAVSHNRYFVKEVAMEIWHLDQDGLEIFKGDYNEYEKYKNVENNKLKEIDKIAVRMRKAELISKLEDATLEKREDIIKELDRLND